MGDKIEGLSEEGVAPPVKTGLSSRALLLAAIVCGIVAAFMNWVYLNRAEGSPIVLMLARDRIPAGTPITEDQFERVELRGKEVERLRGAFVEEKAIPIYENTTTVQTLERGQPLLLRSFQFTEEGDISKTIGPDQRAFALEVNEAQGVANRLRPGQTVDILGTVGRKTYTLKEGACVSPVSEENGVRGGRYNTVILFVHKDDMDNLGTTLKIAGTNVFLSLRPDTCHLNERGTPALAPKEMVVVDDKSQTGKSSATTPSSP